MGLQSQEFGATPLGADSIRQITSEKGPREVPPRARIEVKFAPSIPDKEWWTRLFHNTRLASEHSLRYEIGQLGVYGRPLPSAGWTRELHYEVADLHGDGRRDQIQYILRGRPEPPAVFLPADRGTLRASDDISLATLYEFLPRVSCLSSRRERFALIPGLFTLASLAPDQNDRNKMVPVCGRFWLNTFPRCRGSSEWIDCECCSKLTTAPQSTYPA